MDHSVNIIHCWCPYYFLFTYYLWQQTDLGHNQSDPLCLCSKRRWLEADTGSTHPPTAWWLGVPLVSLSFIRLPFPVTPSLKSPVLAYNDYSQCLSGLLLSSLYCLHLFLFLYFHIFLYILLYLTFVFRFCSSFSGCKINKLSFNFKCI